MVLFLALLIVPVVVMLAPGLMIAEQGYRIGGLQVGAIIGLWAGHDQYGSALAPILRSGASALRASQEANGWKLLGIGIVLLVFSLVLNGSEAGGVAFIAGIPLGIGVQALRGERFRD